MWRRRFDEARSQGTATLTAAVAATFSGSTGSTDIWSFHKAIQAVDTTYTGFIAGSRVTDEDAANTLNLICQQAFALLMRYVNPKEVGFDERARPSSSVLPKSTPLPGTDPAVKSIAIASAALECKETVMKADDLAVFTFTNQVIHKILAAQSATLYGKCLDNVMLYLCVFPSLHKLNSIRQNISDDALLIEQYKCTLSALRALGRVIFCNADRCTRWYDQVCACADGIFQTTVPVAAETPTLVHVSITDVHLAPVTNAAVLLGNLFVKAAVKSKVYQSRALPTVCQLLSWGSSIPTPNYAAHLHGGMPSVLPATLEFKGKLLSALLRLLLATLAQADDEVRALIPKLGEDIVRVLHALMLFNWDADVSAFTKAPSASVMRESAFPGRGGTVSWYSDSDSDSDDEKDATANDIDENEVIWNASGATAPSRSQAPKLSVGGATPARSVKRSCAGSYRESESKPRKQIRRISLRVRVTALQCLQAMARLHARAIHNKWTTFVPEIHGDRPKPYAPSLLTLLLFDRSWRVREAAAAALASVLHDAPFDKWISAPTAASGRVTTAPRASTATSSFSDRIIATIQECHKALTKALLSSTERYTNLVANTLQSCCDLIAATPYSRLATTSTTRASCRRMVEGLLDACLPHMRSEQQHVAVCALHATAAFLSNMAAQSLFEDVPTTSPGSADGVFTRSLIALSHLAASNAGPALRAEVLSVISRAARHQAGHVVQAWTRAVSLPSGASRSLCGIVIDALSDASAPVRTTALKVLEEILRSRAEQTHPSDDSKPTEELEFEGSAADAVAAVKSGDIAWEILQNGNDEAAPLGFVRLHDIINIFLLRCATDAAPGTRSAAVLCISHLLPADWAAIMVAETATSLPYSPAAVTPVDRRNRLLSTIINAATDPIATVRVSVCRLFGVYILHDGWRTPQFMQLAAVILLHLLSDDSVSVRAKASWALGNLCTVDRAEKLDGLEIFPAAEEEWPSTSAMLLALLPHVMHGIVTTLTAEEDVHAKEEAVPPCERFKAGLSQSALVNTLNLPLLRMVTRAMLHALSDVEKVASTAARSLGFCVRGLILHWLPLPAEMKHAVHPTVRTVQVAASSLKYGKTSKPYLSLRETPLDCPDNALIKAAMLALTSAIVGSDTVETAPAPAPAVDMDGPPSVKRVSMAALEKAGPEVEETRAVVEPQKTTEIPSDAAVMKVRWNACHAISTVLPLTHRVVATHGEEWTRDEKKLHNLSVNSKAPSLEAAAAAAFAGSANMLVNSPPRPKVRKETNSGANTVLAGVDHVSTALSPFVPKAVGEGTAAPTAKPDIAADADTFDTATVRYVTDPTQPSVTVDASWVPPLLAGVASALTHCPNIKVKVAAAQCFTSVPSRQAYRIPIDDDVSSALPGGYVSSALPGGYVSSALPGGYSPGRLRSLTYNSPALQTPGFDAFGPAFMCLLENLIRTQTLDREVEVRYRKQLQGATRIALMHMLLLAERLDYGHMKDYFDDKADFIYQWLCAEERCHEKLDAVDASAEAEEESSTSTMNLQAEPGISTETVQAAFRSVTNLFQSRVKTIPQSLLRRFQSHVQEHSRTAARGHIVVGSPSGGVVNSLGHDTGFVK